MDCCVDHHQSVDRAMLDLLLDLGMLDALKRVLKITSCKLMQHKKRETPLLTMMQSASPMDIINHATAAATQHQHGWDNGDGGDGGDIMLLSRSKRKRKMVKKLKVRVC
jgi:hypothetical protein